MIRGTQKKISDSPKPEANSVFDSLWSVVKGLFSMPTQSATEELQEKNSPKSPALKDSSSNDDNNSDFGSGSDCEDDSDAEFQPGSESDYDSENDEDFQPGSDSDYESDCDSELENDTDIEVNSNDKPFDLISYLKWKETADKKKKSSKRPEPEKSINSSDSDSDAEVKHESTKRHCKR